MRRRTRESLCFSTGFSPTAPSAEHGCRNWLVGGLCHETEGRGGVVFKRTPGALFSLPSAPGLLAWELSGRLRRRAAAVPEARLPTVSSAPLGPCGGGPRASECMLGSNCLLACTSWEGATGTEIWETGDNCHVCEEEAELSQNMTMCTPLAQRRSSLRRPPKISLSRACQASQLPAPAAAGVAALRPNPPPAAPPRPSAASRTCFLSGGSQPLE